MEQVVQLAAIALTVLLGIAATHAANAGTLVPGTVIPGMPAADTPAPPTAAPTSPAPSATAPETAPVTPAPSAAGPEASAPKRTAPKAVHRRKAVRHRPAPRKEPAAEEAQKPGAVEEAARTCINNRLKALIAEDQREDIAADAALSACTNGLKAEFKAEKKGYCDAVSYIAWLVADENSKLDGIQGEPYQPDRAFIQDCAKTHRWEKDR